VDEAVERPDTLGEALLEQAPFVARKNARNHVEWDQPLLRFLFAVNRERDADPPEDELGLAPPIIQHVRRNFLQPLGKWGVDRPNRATVAVHFVERPHHPIYPRHARYQARKQTAGQQNCV
jgi:hypothetical protein